MTLPYRIAAYIVAVLIGTAYIVWCVYTDAQEKLHDDPSAMAAFGFLPFFLPFFALGAAAYVAPVAAVIEIALAIWRWWK